MFSVFVPDHPNHMSEFLTLLNPLSIPELHIPKYLRIFFSIFLCLINYLVYGSVSFPSYTNTFISVFSSTSAWMPTVYSSSVTFKKEWQPPAVILFSFAEQIHNNVKIVSVLNRQHACFG